ncbi:Gp37-like protein [Cellulomonas sp. Marseille-Q8402]
MQTSDLLVEVRDASLARVAQIAPSHLDLSVDLVDCAVGSWTLRLPAEHPAVQHLVRPGAGIIVTGPDGVAFSGPVDTPTVDADLADPTGVAAISGVTDDVLLWNRLAYPTPSALAASAQTDAYDVRSGRPETVMLDYVRANLGAAAPPGRRVPALVLASDERRGTTDVRKSARFDVLGDLLSEIATVSGLRFRLVQVGPALRFEVLEVRDRRDTVRFDLANGTLSAHSVAVAPPRVTRAVVGGAGEGALRELIDVSDPANEHAEAARGPWGRVETFVDNRSGSSDELQQAGAKVLADGAGSTSAAAVPSDDLTMRYAVDWDLGDAVTVVVGGSENVARVTGVSLIVDQSGARVGATIGELQGSTPVQALTRRTDAVDRRVSALERTAEAGSVSQVPVDGDLDTYTTSGTWTLDASASSRVAHVPALGAGVLTVAVADSTVIQTCTVSVSTGGPPRSVTYRRVRGAARTWGPWEVADGARALGSQAEQDRLRDAVTTVDPSAPLVVVRTDAPGQAFRVSADGGHTWEQTRPAPVPYAYPELGNEFVRYGNRFHAAGYYMSSAGTVALTGLVTGGTNGTALFTLPQEMRPAGRRLFLVMSGDGVGRVDIRETGEVTVQLRPTTSTWVSLDGILFPSAAVAPESAWAPVPAFGPGWSDYRAVDATWPPVSSYQDIEGRVWFRGLLRGAGGAVTADQAAVNTGRGGPPVQVHVPGLGTSAFASLDVLPDGWIRVKAGTAGSAWVSLCHAMYVPASVRPTGDYEALPTYWNGWLDYSAAQPSQSLLRLGDGMVMLGGMIKSGTVAAASPSLALPPGAAPDTQPFANRGRAGDLIFPGNANNASARFDLGSMVAGSIGTPVLSQYSGSNFWRSLHGISYYIGG